MFQKQNFKLSLILTLITAVFVLSLQVFAADDGQIPQREDIEDQYKWKVEDIYPTVEAWEKDFAYLKGNTTSFEKFKGHLSDSPEALLECLRLRDSLEVFEGNLYVYAYLKLDEDNRKSEYQELGGRISALSSELSSATSFIDPEIIGMAGDKLNSFLNTALDLGEYRFYLEDLMRQKEHILSEKEEAILALAGPMSKVPLDAFQMIDNADLKLGSIIDDDGNKIDLTWGRYARLMEEGSRDVRRAANDTVQAQYLKYVNTLAATLGGSLQKDLFFSKARKYNSCVDYALSGDNIPEEVLRNLVASVNANLEPLHKLTRLRKKLMGVDTLFTYDMSVPLGSKSDKEYTYEEAKQIVSEGLKPMGDKYLNDFNKGLESGWIDVYETEGKGTGAYQWGTHTSHPYILLNFTGRMDDIFTLAHEMGHGMNSFYSNMSEPYIYHNHSTFTAEVASTVNEAVLMKYMLAKVTDKTEKLTLLNQYINQIRGTFFTQVMFTEFELAAHDHVENGGAVSVDFFRKTYREIYQKYYGPELVIGPENDMTGMKIYHFYRQYYVYQYATSYAAAQMLSQRILEGESGVQDTYLKFLSTGVSKYPVDILKEAGVDMTKPDAVDRTLQLFSDLVDQMEQLLAEG